VKDNIAPIVSEQKGNIMMPRIAELKRWRVFVVLSCLTLGAAVPAAAQTKQTQDPGYKTLGAGAARCAEWTAHKANPTLAAADRMWVMGYLTRANVTLAYVLANEHALVTYQDLTRGLDENYLAGWIDAYCLARPAETVEMGRHSNFTARWSIAWRKPPTPRPKRRSITSNRPNRTAGERAISTVAVAQRRGSTALTAVADRSYKSDCRACYLRPFFLTICSCYVHIIQAPLPGKPCSCWR
jgi:hypothetical protein